MAVAGSTRAGPWPGTAVRAGVMCGIGEAKIAWRCRQPIAAAKKSLAQAEQHIKRLDATIHPTGDGTDVTESFRMTSSPFVGIYYWLFGGWLRQRRNVRDMTKTLNRIKDVAEA